MGEADLKRDEIVTFLEFVQIDDEDRKRRARAAQLMANIYDNGYIPELLGLLDEAGATGSFAVLGRDAAEQGSLVNDIADAGHDVVFHGHRHASFGEMDYDTATEHVSTGMEAIEEAAGIRPTGFFVPFKQVSAGTLDAAAEAGIEWIIGETDAEVPDTITMLQVESPYDAQLLVSGGKPPAEAFDELQQMVTGGQVFLFHPTLVDYAGGMDEFGSWLERNQPTAVSEFVDDGQDGLGLMVDATAPIRIR